ncbi:hypothetical protein FQN52_005029 [Onygenales sp. PD_12]|nr:hypothetical protein FQN53_006185 [Emmonsiellopsis sp. PD_33]KAK2791075.1 hypothetical protein FQN52_005029 [Onygenales sp. PD_12]KAK2800898.1 hypothetical protein FQN51_005833 [Onygenales sp. PD_10]
MAGYDELAKFITADPGLSIYRRFSYLNTKNILYLQAELVNLEAQLERIIREDIQSQEPNRELFPYSLWHLKWFGQDPKSRDSLQWTKVLEIRKTLKEYNNAIFQQSQLMKLEGPSSNNLSVLRDWLIRPEGGNLFLKSWEFDTWKYDNDLMCLGGLQNGTDSLTRWIYERVIPWFHDHWGHSHKQPDPEGGVYIYDDKKILMATNIASAILSSLLPALSILILYLIKNPFAKLGAMIGFTVAFAIVIAIVVKARRVETFAAATAFAAVQAVFIGGSCDQACK